MPGTANISALIFRKNMGRNVQVHFLMVLIPTQKEPLRYFVSDPTFMLTRKAQDGPFGAAVEALDVEETPIPM